MYNNAQSVYIIKIFINYNKFDKSFIGYNMYVDIT